MGHRMWSMFASARRSWGVGALHSLWQQEDCQRRLRWVSVINTHRFLNRGWICSDILSSHVCLCSKIKVWDLQAALDPRAPASTLCLRTLVVSTKVLVSPESSNTVSPQKVKFHYILPYLVLKFEKRGEFKTTHKLVFGTPIEHLLCLIQLSSSKP